MRTVFGLSIPRPEKESVGRAHCGRGVAIVRARHAVRRALGTTARAVLPEAVRIPAWVVWRYAQRFGVLPNLLAPKTFNEKILHRILFDRRPILTTLQDKYAVREYVRARIGAHVLPEMYWATNDPSTIPFDTLPRKFVVKPTHASGWAELVVDKASVNPRALVETCRGWLRQNYYYAEGEWVYKNIEPRIIVEEFIDDGTGSVPTDYKLFVFDGRVELIAIHQSSQQRVRAVQEQAGRDVLVSEYRAGRGSSEAPARDDRVRGSPRARARLCPGRLVRYRREGLFRGDHDDARRRDGHLSPRGVRSPDGRDVAPVLGLRAENAAPPTH